VPRKPGPPKAGGKSKKSKGGGRGGARPGAGRPKNPPRGVVVPWPTAPLSAVPPPAGAQPPQQKAKGTGPSSPQPPAPPPRPPDLIPGTNVDWFYVQHYARTNATRKQIVEGLGIPKAVLDQPEILARLHREVEQGRALYKLDLLEALRVRGIVDGSVNTLLAAARENLRWDKHEHKEEAPPDTEAAEAELAAVLRQVGKSGK
jgi:hypothetical protein